MSFRKTDAKPDVGSDEDLAIELRAAAQRCSELKRILSERGWDVYISLSLHQTDIGISRRVDL